MQGEGFFRRATENNLEASSARRAIYIIYDLAIICKIDFNKLFQKFFSMRSSKNIKKRIAAEDKLCELLRICRRGALGAHQSVAGECKRGGRAWIPLGRRPSPRRGSRAKRAKKFFGM